MLRPGRFDRILEVPIPDKEARHEILKIHTSRKPLDNDVDINKLVDLTDGYTGADITATVNAAAMSAIKEQVTSMNEKKIMTNEENAEKQANKLRISMRHFELALQKIRKKTPTNTNLNLPKSKGGTGG